MSKQDAAAQKKSHFQALLDAWSIIVFNRKREVLDAIVMKLIMNTKQEERNPRTNLESKPASFKDTIPVIPASISKW